MTILKAPTTTGHKGFAAWVLVVLLQISGTAWYAHSCESRGRGGCDLPWALFLAALGVSTQTLGAAMTPSPLRDQPSPSSSAPGDVIPITRPRRSPEDEPPAA